MTRTTGGPAIAHTAVSSLFSARTGPSAAGTRQNAKITYEIPPWRAVNASLGRCTPADASHACAPSTAAQEASAERVGWQQGLVGACRAAVYASTSVAEAV